MQPFHQIDVRFRERSKTDNWHSEMRFLQLLSHLEQHGSPPQNLVRFRIVRADSCASHLSILAMKPSGDRLRFISQHPGIDGFKRRRPDGSPHPSLRPRRGLRALRE